MENNICPGLYVLSARLKYPEGGGYFLAVYPFAVTTSEEFNQKVEAYREGCEKDGFEIEESVILQIDPEVIQDLETERVEE